MAKFEIGEVVIINIPGASCHNLEATILGTVTGLRYSESGSEFGFLYVLDVSGAGRIDGDGRKFACFERELRKKRPPEQPADEDFREWFDKTIANPVTEDTMRRTMANMAGFTTGGGNG